MRKGGKGVCVVLALDVFSGVKGVKVVKGVKDNSIICFMFLGVKGVKVVKGVKDNSIASLYKATRHASLTTQ